ncbi:uncharacterized protein LOC129223265 [Uloborus diversus]|uniref:uncharacterized protein LOC129223265 n=1 Tax=Uloborus diversus TaxID=327109 RepID=UPI002409F8E5|nr:uncharacterized protein LOC129223265 [Uloborus diversus]
MHTIIAPTLSARPWVAAPHNSRLHPQQHFEDSSHPELLSATSSTTNSGYTPSVSSQSSSPDIEAYHMPHHHHRPGKESGNASCFGEPHHHHLYKPKIWSLADTATNKAVETALMPYVHQDLCSPAGGTWLGGGGTSKGYENCNSSSLSFQRFGGYNCSLHSFNPISLQTDTPPQTPPNMKVGATAAAAPVPSSAYMESAAYAMGHASALCAPTTDGMPDVQMQDDKMDDFSNSHSSGLPQTSTSNQNLNSDCIADDYDDPSQYSGQAVR